MIIKGIPSGDCECWCLLVTKKTFTDLKGSPPGEFDSGRFAKKGSPYRYMVYPDTLFGFGERGNGKGELCIISVDVKREKDVE